VRRFDANSYLYITRAIDYFDLEGEFTSLAEAMSRARAEFLIVSVSTDWLYPTAQARELVDALAAGGRRAHHVEVASPHGHDAFLIESPMLTPYIKRFLAQGLEGQG
jgi:homoserine O-acetyltransferase